MEWHKRTSSKHFTSIERDSHFYDRTRNKYVVAYFVYTHKLISNLQSVKHESTDHMENNEIKLRMSLLFMAYLWFIRDAVKLWPCREFVFFLNGCKFLNK